MTAGVRQRRQYRLLARDRRKLIVSAVEGAAEGGREICGVLVDNGYFLEVVHLDNKRKTGGGYEFYPRQVTQLRGCMDRLGHEIVGTFHSHPFYIAKPSESDIAGVPDPSLMLIVDVMDKKIALWSLRKGKAKKLILEILR